MGVNEVKLTSNEIIKELKNNINNEWLKDLTLTEEQLDDIISCIKSCTSPKKEDIFNAFSLFKPSETRVLILGQDPYTDKEKGKAIGLAFLLNRKINKNDSLYYILRAINKNNDIEETELQEEPKKEKILNWAKLSGVLLLNTALTYDKEHSKTDRINCWKPFIQQIIIKVLTEKEKGLEVYLWGKDAQNLFLQILNDDKFKNIRNQIKNKNFLINRVKEENKLKNGAVIPNKNFALSNNITLFMDYHPSPINYKKGKIFNNQQFRNKEIWNKLLKIYTK